MAVSVPQRSFTGGEWSPSLSARVDLAKYPTALKLCENFIVQPFGGVTSRPGTEFLAEALDSTKALKLVPFQFSVEQGYILEFGDQTMRVYRDGNLVLADVSGIANWALSTGYTIGDFVVGTLDSIQTTTWREGLYFEIGDYVTASSGGIALQFRCIKNHVAEAANDPYSSSDHWETAMVGGYPKGIYRCIQNHTSTANDEPFIGINWATYWVLDGYAYGPYELATPWPAEDLALLTYEQSYDVLFMQHPDYPPKELSRTAHNNWTVASVVFGATVLPPTNVTGGSGSDHDWKITSVDGEESLPTASYLASSGTLTWTPPASQPHYYNIYMRKNLSGSWGWVDRVMAAGGLSSYKIDNAKTPDYSKQPPEAQTPFNGADDYPGVATFFEQRLIYARTNNLPQTLWGSKTGFYRNFDISTPLQADDAFEFTLAARQLHDVRWLVPLDDLLIGTGGGEWRMSPGGDSDAVTPTSVNLRMQSQWGCATIRPVVIGNAVIFIDASLRVVRDLAYDLNVNGYQGNDLTLMAQHLFKGYTLADIAYQQHPDTVLWVVRDDGVLLGLTYAREHQVWGWHRHTTDGDFENVCSIFNAAGEVHTYVVVTRTVGGTEKKYIELFKDRLVNDEVDRAWAVDGGVHYNGLLTDRSYSLTLTGGTNWTVGESLTLTSSESYLFDSSDVGKYFKLKLGDDSVVVEVTAFTSGTVLTVTPYDRVVPVSMRATALHDWGRMITSMPGLEHLEGLTVQIVLDGNVQTEDTVSSGAVAFAHPAIRAFVGLGYTCNLETLEIEISAESGTLQDRLRSPVEITLRLENTRGIKVGPDADHLDEIAFRDDELYGDPTALFTGDKAVLVDPSDGTTGKLYLRNDQPVPTTVLSVIPRVDFGDG